MGSLNFENNNSSLVSETGQEKISLASTTECSLFQAPDTISEDANNKLVSDEKHTTSEYLCPLALESTDDAMEVVEDDNSVNNTNSTSTPTKDHVAELYQRDVSYRYIVLFLLLSVFTVGGYS